jgi:hypothetical protein
MDGLISRHCPDMRPARVPSAYLFQIILAAPRAAMQPEDERILSAFIVTAGHEQSVEHPLAARILIDAFAEKL